MTESEFITANIPNDIAHPINDCSTIRQPNIAICFSRIFGTATGRTALRHLRLMTIERTLSPSASDASLRHLEGQRQLVSYICALVERGRTAPPPASYPAFVDPHSHEEFDHEEFDNAR